MCRSKDNIATRMSAMNTSKTNPEKKNNGKAKRGSRRSQEKNMYNQRLENIYNNPLLRINSCALNQLDRWLGGRVCRNEIAKVAFS